MSSIERNSSLLRPSSMSNPKLPFKRDITPPTVSDPALLHIHDRLNQLDSKVLDLRASVLTKDAYVDRRNREDTFIRREFDRVSSRVDTAVDRTEKTRTDVGSLKTDLSQLKSEINQLKTCVEQLSSRETFLQSDVSQIQNAVNQLHIDVRQLHSDVCAARTDISQVQALVSQIRIDLMILQRENGAVLSRLSAMESRMTHSERVRFNSLALTIYAPISPVPKIEEDGSLTWPKYFPSTVWKFWCLKKRSRLHRLVELAEFYELEGYQNWSRMPNSQDSLFPGDGYSSDSSDSSDRPSDITRAEAVRLYPEACHQVLAATLGLVYPQIRKEVGEGPSGMLPQHTSKRSYDDAVSVNSSVRPKSKVARRSNNDISPTRFQKMLTEVQTIDTKSIVSQGFDKLGWDPHASQMSDETMSKLKDIVADEVNARLLRALECGAIRIQPSSFEQQRGRMSPTEMSVRTRMNRDDGQAAFPAGEEVPTEPSTVPTEIISPVSSRGYKGWTDQASEAGSP
ncbi:hypothetical protein VTO42DRAFT_8548 [Malbranchea cinnamomea]